MSNGFRNSITTMGVGLLLAVGPGAFGATGTGLSAHRESMVIQAQASEPRKVFHAVGIVTATKPAGSLTINHQPIEGLMPAMEMMFSVKPRALSDGVRPGDKVEFNVEGATFTIVGLKVVGHTH